MFCKIFPLLLFTDTISHLESLNMKLISTFALWNYFQCKKYSPYNGQFFTVAQIPLFIFAVHSQFEFCNIQIIFSRTNWKTNLKWISLPKKSFGKSRMYCIPELAPKNFHNGTYIFVNSDFSICFGYFPPSRLFAISTLRKRKK